jgi:uncharacterized protein HemX
MSNIPEETGKVARSAIDSLRGTPGLLTVVILQVITLGALVYISQTNRQNQQAREMYLLEKCLDGQHIGKELP